MKTEVKLEGETNNLTLDEDMAYAKKYVREEAENFVADVFRSLPAAQLAQGGAYTEFCGGKKK